MERFRGKIIPVQREGGEPGVREVSKEEGLRIEEENIKIRLETVTTLTTEEKERLEARLEEIKKERERKEERPPSRRQSVIKI